MSSSSGKPLESRKECQILLIDIIFTGDEGKRIFSWRIIAWILLFSSFILTLAIPLWMCLWP